MERDEVGRNRKRWDSHLKRKRAERWSCMWIIKGTKKGEELLMLVAMVFIDIMVLIEGKDEVLG